jgi:hypothetical protein
MVTKAKSSPTPWKNRVAMQAHGRRQKPQAERNTEKK